MKHALTLFITFLLAIDDGAYCRRYTGDNRESQYPRHFGITAGFALGESPFFLFRMDQRAAPHGWPMISRSTPNGEPGSSKLLTPVNCAASSWATLGVTRLVPKGD